MWKKIVVVGAAAAIIGGAGTAAFAASGTTAPPPSVAVSSSASDIAASDASTVDSSASGSSEIESKIGARRHGIAHRLRKVVHATWVSENKKTKTFTTHQAIRGHVTAVSATSITVKATDNATLTYVLNSDTKVHTRANRKAASISDVKSGDSVWVSGTGTTALTASQIVDPKK